VKFPVWNGRNSDDGLCCCCSLLISNTCTVAEQVAKESGRVGKPGSWGGRNDPSKLITTWSRTLQQQVHKRKQGRCRNIY
jgi:hypothetical protein